MAFLVNNSFFFLLFFEIHPVFTYNLPPGRRAHERKTASLHLAAAGAGRRPFSALGGEARGCTEPEESIRGLRPRRRRRAVFSAFPDDRRRLPRAAGQNDRRDGRGHGRRPGRAGDRGVRRKGVPPLRHRRQGQGQRPAAHLFARRPFRAPGGGLRPGGGYSRRPGLAPAGACSAGPSARRPLRPRPFPGRPRCRRPGGGRRRRHAGDRRAGRMAGRSRAADVQGSTPAEKEEKLGPAAGLPVLRRRHPGFRPAGQRPHREAASTRPEAGRRGRGSPAARRPASSWPGSRRRSPSFSSSASAGSFSPRSSPCCRRRGWPPSAACSPAGY